MSGTPPGTSSKPGCQAVANSGNSRRPLAFPQRIRDQRLRSPDSLVPDFVTQQVTQRHNVLLTAMTVCLAIEAWRQKRWPNWSVVCGLAVIDAALIFQHMHLLAMLDFNSRSIADDFYPPHATYLWLTAVEWLFGLAVPFTAGLPGHSESTSPAICHP